jgi:hypothetical protein
MCCALSWWYFVGKDIELQAAESRNSQSVKLSRHPMPSAEQEPTSGSLPSKMNPLHILMSYLRSILVFSSHWQYSLFSSESPPFISYNMPFEFLPYVLYGLPMVWYILSFISDAFILPTLTAYKIANGEPHADCVTITDKIFIILKYA